MKRKIFLQILGATALVLVLLFAACVAIMYANGKKVVRERLTVETKLSVDLLDNSGEYSVFDEYYNNDELRVTVISKQGKVLFESDLGEDLEENHLDREEVRYAIAGQPKTVDRYSETFGCRMTYYALCDTLSDGTEIIVRLAIKSSELSSYLLPAIPFLLVSLAVAIVIALLFAEKLSKRVSKKVTEVGDSLRSLNAGLYQPLSICEDEPEFASVFKEINALNESTHAYILREEEIIRQKSDFFANASHELKTPITVMRGLTEIMLSKEGLDEQDKKQISRIHKESLRMASLISDMLKLSKLERGEAEERQEVELRDIADEVTAELAEEMKGKNLTVSVQGKGQVYADPKKMYEILQNLCSNAVNYNKENGKIDIRIEETDGTVQLFVEDSGIGIEKEHIPRLCERFYRVDKSRSKKTGGTGLGLAIVKHVCALYKAELSIESEIDKGTRVSVTFYK